MTIINCTPIGTEAVNINTVLDSLLTAWDEDHAAITIVENSDDDTELSTNVNGFATVHFLCEGLYKAIISLKLCSGDNFAKAVWGHELNLLNQRLNEYDSAETQKGEPNDN